MLAVETRAVTTSARARELLAHPSGRGVYSPRWIGDDRPLFAAL